MNLYSKARKHIDMKRVKEMREEKIKERIEQIALQEQEYLLHFTQNVVPKHYDWRTGKFNEKSLEEINKIVLDRLEKIDNALSEGMSSKDFKYLYGGVLTYDIVSVNPTAVSSTFAQDLIGASNELTSYMFGPNFPGSHINSIGDFDKPESLSKADINAMAVPTPAGDAISWNPFNSTLPTNFQLGGSTPLGAPQSDIAALDNTATRMVSRGETTDTHTDIYYSPEISQTDATITITRQARTNDYIDYAALDSHDLMVLTGLWSVNNATKPMGLLSTQINDTNLYPMPYGYDSLPADNTFPDENEDAGEPLDLMPMLRTYNNKSAGDVISFEWEFDAGTGHESNPTNADDANSAYDDSAWVFINGSNTWYRLANLYDFDNHRIGDDDYYRELELDVHDEGDSRQEDNAGRKEIRPQFRTGGSGKMSGSFSYTVQSGDIDSNGNLKVWIINNQITLFDRANVLKITNLTGTTSAADRRKQAAGELGQTTDAFDLGYRAQTPAELRKLLKGIDLDNFKIGVGNTNLTAGELKKVLKKDPKIANAVEKLGTQGKAFLDYLTGNLPDTIDNEYLGQEYVNSIFQDAEINSKGTISVGDNIVGTGGKAKYDPKTGEVSIPFNYDFKTNTDEFKDPSKAGVSDFQKAILNAVGPYSADAQPNLPKALAPVQGAAGIIFGAAIAASKALGGAKQKSGKVTMSADRLEKINPTLHAQLVGLGEKKLKEQLYPGQPSPNGFPDTPPPQLAPNGYHPEFGKRSNRYRRLDPISAKTMDKVGTDDPETNNQVSAAAADSKPKKLPSGAVKKYTRRNVVKKESNNLYTRSTKYIDMKRVKEIREEKIKKQKIDNLVERQLEIAAELKEIEKPVDWRSDLNEMMTTAWTRIPKT